MTSVEPKSGETSGEPTGLEMSEMELLLEIQRLGFNASEWLMVRQRIVSFDHRNRPIYEPETVPAGWYLTMLDHEGVCRYAGRQAEWITAGWSWVTPIKSLRDCLAIAKQERQRLNADEAFEEYRRASQQAVEERARRLLREILE
jgi:hypothetical protein